MNELIALNEISNEKFKFSIENRVTSDIFLKRKDANT